MKPRWRWLVFCLALEAYWLTSWEWSLDLAAWATLPEWCGWEPGDRVSDGEEVPF